MSLLPSPIPHPLDYSPWELPGWVYEALDWVIGVEWPEGDERAVWDLADQWYGVAEALTGPRDDAVAAAGEVRSGYGGIGAVAEAFDAAWRRVADGDEAPLPVLLAVSGDLGRLVEECGCDIEGAKLEVWIELGILVVELLSLAVAAVLTAGAASPAAGAAITASRFVVQQIFKRLMAQLARKTLKQGLKEAGERAAKRVAEGGVRGLARKAALGGLAEAAEEAGVTLATQAYQNTTGRRNGLDLADAGMSALGGLAGGAVAPLAGLGRHATGRAARVGEHLGREMTGEMIAEQAARLATGQGPMSLEDAARAAASGATGSATGQTDAALHHRLDGRMAALAGASFAPTDLGAVSVPTTPDGAQLPAAGMTVGMTSREGDQPQPVDGGVPSERVVAAAQSPATATTPAQAQAPFVPPVDTPGLPAAPVMSAITVDPTVGLPASPQSGPGAVDAAGPAHPVLSSIPADAAQPGNRGVETGPPAAAGGTPSTASGSSPVPLTGATSTPHSSPISAASGVNPTTLPPVVSASPYGTASPFGATGQNSSVTGHDPTPPPRLPPLETGHPHPRPAPQPTPQSAPEPPDPADPTVPVPRSPEWYAAQWAAEREAFDRRRYRDYFQRQRAWYEDKRRRDRAAELREGAEQHYEQARWLIREAYGLHRAGRSDLADQFVRDGRQAERQHHRQMTLAEEVLAGRAAPKVVEVDNREDFERINSDDPSLIVGVVEGDGPSALTGDDNPPPIDRSRRYGQWGGLRPPLALHQSDLEQAVPRDAGGRVMRTADPRRGRWFRLANDGGPAADPTRGINCLDCTLSFYETWMHGRPRVSAPRTFDGYAVGDITRPLGGEIDGPGRVEDATGGRFQKVVGPDEEGLPGDTWRAVSRGFGSLEGRLRAGGHGSYAFLITTYEGGGSHAWVALNQNGSVLYLDPQSGAVSDMPLYTHSSRPAPHNVTGLDALILGPDGRPMPLAGAGPGTFSQRAEVSDEPPAPVRERQPGPDDPSDDDLYINRMHLLEGPAAVDPGPRRPEKSGRPKDFPPTSGEGEADSEGDRLRQARNEARDHRLASGISPKRVVAASSDLDQVFAAGVTPAELASELDGATLRRLVPQLDEAAAQDVARLLADHRVRQMLDDTWRVSSIGEPLLAEMLVGHMVQQPNLARMMLETPELVVSLTARPETLHHLASYERAIGVLESVAVEVNGRDLNSMADASPPKPRPTPLSAEQREISASVDLGSSDPAQPGFDQTRRADVEYQAEFLERLYQASVPAQEELVTLAQGLAHDGDRVVGAAGWRPRPKGRQRAEDKIRKYQGDVSRLLDLAAAKVEFNSLGDVYKALERLRDNPRVQIVACDDRFQAPQNSGYRDVQLVLRMSNGHLAEFRLHLASMDEVAAWEHSLYEVKRDLEALARQDGRKLNLRERAIVDGILERQQQLFWNALISSL
ncbi:toxin glutamine deamidase domain-containing protein [Micromonospora sp. NPDC001898]|uniref:toxin glutamine deamidase domain-containing protein n=1 Tax=Micromonospora sp. NPDC001898 TaxID=3364221 RepID=UPI0036A0A39D